MSKFDRAYEIFTKNGADKADRKATISAIAKELKVTEANAGVYFYKSVKKFEASGSKPAVSTVAEPVKQKITKEEKPVKEPKRVVKRVAGPDKTNPSSFPKLEPMTEAERLGEAIPDFVPDFLLSDAQRRIRAKQK